MDKSRIVQLFMIVKPLWYYGDTCNNPYITVTRAITPKLAGRGNHPAFAERSEGLDSTP
jgi:hypothetical protein